jgi:hypothetical protein
MSEPKQVGDIQVNQDLNFQHKAWLVQRAGWILMTLALIAGLAGFFGDGPASRAQAGGIGVPVSAEYDRFTRLQMPSRITFRLEEGSVQDGKAHLWISRELEEGMKVIMIQPPADSVKTSQNGLEYLFEVGDTGFPAFVILSYWPERTGYHQGSIGSSSQNAIPIWQLVLP